MPNDVLIHTTESSIAHKRRGNVPPGETPFWTVSGTPRQTEPGCRIWFEADSELIATGEIVDVVAGRILFEPLVDADGEPPVDPPSRGFTYVDGDEFDNVGVVDAVAIDHEQHPDERVDVHRSNVIVLPVSLSDVIRYFV